MKRQDNPMSATALAEKQAGKNRQSKSLYAAQQLAAVAKQLEAMKPGNTSKPGQEMDHDR